MGIGWVACRLVATEYQRKTRTLLVSHRWFPDSCCSISCHSLSSHHADDLFWRQKWWTCGTPKLAQLLFLGWSGLCSMMKEVHACPTPSVSPTCCTQIFQPGDYLWHPLNILSFQSDFAPSHCIVPGRRRFILSALLERPYPLLDRRLGSKSHLSLGQWFFHLSSPPGPSTLHSPRTWPRPSIPSLWLCRAIKLVAHS